ncbi:aldo/keto reductase [Marinivivus vitaminiproducens]|uniref:aldo/keto reductase n=1 Tax=Marinivivus vitaminiproducens TaxID=3035935 RepID=UPI00279A5FAD|nr:aldo/keto reductase [Geminicoccaceae bacterium SCSIO 64248]
MTSGETALADGNTRTLRWGILGTGAIARIFAAGVAGSRHGRLAVVATRAAPTAEAQAAFEGVPVVQGYETVLADPDIDAVYVATPHPTHLEHGLAALRAGKHVLCEKPMGVSAVEAMVLIDEARRAGLFLAEAFMYRLHPQTARVAGLVAEGRIGDVRLIQASFGFRKPFDAGHRLYANDQAGGGILDVGCYPVSLARLIAGTAAGVPFLDPVKVTGLGHLGETGVDEWTAAVLAFPNGIIAQVATSIAVAQDNAVRIHGTDGRIEIASPWFCGGRTGGSATLRIVPANGEAEDLTIDDPSHLYAFEVDAVARAITAGRTELDPPGMTWADTLGNMQALDAWRAAIGLAYDLESPQRRARPLSGRPLKHGRLRSMPKRALPGLDKPASALALGQAWLDSVTHAGAMNDAYFERGGNLFDSAWLYGQGKADIGLGHWLGSRGVREEVIVLGKGAHTPLCYPDVIPRQLTQSLDRLQTDYLDLYMMHRDNPDVPVGEFVDVLDREIHAGRFRAYGFSNWPLERVQAAMRYARETGRHAPVMVSNNFSLARMVEPQWAGCIASSVPEWEAWHREERVPCLAWSSQARGFFTPRAGRDIRTDPDLVRCWYSDENFRRRDVAAVLGEAKGGSANQVALAYCLAQDFPVLPIIGPRTLQELDDSVGALDVALSPDDVRRLDLA